MLGRFSASAVMLALIGMTGCRQPNPDWVGPASDTATGGTTDPGVTTDATASTASTTDVADGGASSGESSSGGPGSCPEGQLECSGGCIDPNIDPMHCGDCDIACAEDRECVAAVCECMGNRTDCGGECVNTNNNAMHCGECDNACPNNRTECEKGICQ